MKTIKYKPNISSAEYIMKHSLIIIYHKTSNISYSVVGNYIVDRSDVVGASPVILDLTPGFNGLGKGNCKTRRVILKFWDLARLMLEIWSCVQVYRALYKGKDLIGNTNFTSGHQDQAYTTCYVTRSLTLTTKAIGYKFSRMNCLYSG